ncbi:MAG: hypothetical protein IH624_16775 [Phycisphaerae bacterium]|nr:hypothetical protein [Phycisphaerae bacterium]
MDDVRRVRWRWMAMVLAGCLISGSAFGIVLHPGKGEPEVENWIDRPADEVMGRWANNASCVAISPNCVITTRHQGGGIGTVVRIAGASYKVEAIWAHPGRVNPLDANYREVDLRIAKLGRANLRHYAALFTGTGEVYKGKCAVIGGYGVGRGSELTKYGITYGYAWDGADSNSHFRWCTNSIDAVREDVKSSDPRNGSLNNHNLVIAAFDDPLTTPAEGAVAAYDSGGGWFVRVDDNWRLAGVTWGADRAQNMETLFRSSTSPTIASPDRMYALRISSYADWIGDVLASVCAPGHSDLNGDCNVNMQDLARLAAHWLRRDCSGSNNFCFGADINGDGRVDAADLHGLKTDYTAQSN